MSNETFLLIALAIVATVIITTVIIRIMDSKKKKEAVSVVDFITAAVGQFETAVEKIYRSYVELGGIERLAFRSDQDYRRHIIEETVGIILKELENAGVSIPDNKNDLIEGIAVSVVESAIDLSEKAKAEKVAADLEKQVAEIKAKEEAVAVANATDEQRNLVKVSLGDFYSEEE